MCSQYDDPSTYTAPEPVRPRTYVLSGDPLPGSRVVVEEPRASIALAILGEMLNEAERNTDKYPESRSYWAVQAEVLRRARDRVAAAGG